MSSYVLTKKMNETKEKLLILGSAALSFLYARGTFLAATTQLGQSFEKVSGNFLTEFKSVYCGSLCWLLLAIESGIVVFCKNDKAVGYAKKALWGSIVLYILLMTLVKPDAGVIGNTATDISTWFN